MTDRLIYLHEPVRGTLHRKSEGLFHPCKMPESDEESTHKISGQPQPAYTPTYPRPKPHV